MDNKTAVMEQYLFHLAFENQETDDYITEKLWGALASGTLPVYLGAKNIKEHVPRNSIIVAEDFKSPQNLADYLIRLTNDKYLYESYHKWRYQTIDDPFASKYEFTNTHSTCRMCKWVFAKRQGLGWNHSKQTISKPHIDHKTCRNEMGLIGYPFKEGSSSYLQRPRPEDLPPPLPLLRKLRPQRTQPMSARSSDFAYAPSSSRRNSKRILRLRVHLRVL